MSAWSMTRVPSVTSAASAPPLLEACDVARSFGGVVALAGVSIAVEAGELLGVVGPDGAGKTTLVRALTGLLDVDRGEARVDGVPWSRANANARERLGYMPQQFGLYAELSVDENLSFFAQLFGLARNDFRERRARLLALTQLEAAASRPAGKLSGGMYKKLAVACALLHKPAVLVLDEPTNGVDPVSRRELWELLYELTSDGTGVVLATPYMDEAARCSRVALLASGKVLAAGAPKDLVDAFEHTVLEITAPDRAAVDALLASSPDVLAVTPAGVRIRTVVRAGHDAEVWAKLVAMGAKVVATRTDFEDLYLARLATTPPPSVAS